MAKWMLRMGAVAALGLVAAMVVLAMCGDPLATLPHAGGAFRCGDGGARYVR